MNLPLVVVANRQEKIEAAKLFKKHKIMIIGEGFYQVLINLKKINKKKPIINFGMVGSDDFKIGEVIEIGSSKLLHVNNHIKDKTFKLSDSGIVCYTANSFVTKDETHDKKSVFDMELYYILALGYNVVRAVKKVSDNLSYKQYKQYK